MVLFLLRTVETSLATLCTSISTHLLSISRHLQTYPLSSRVALPALPPIQPHHYTFFSLVLALLLIFLAPLIFRALYPNPILMSFPFPSLNFDPLDDPQADIFPDSDVQPQLSPSGLPCIDPRDATVFAHVKPHTPHQVRLMVTLARNAAHKYAHSTFAQRNVVMRVIRDYILYNQKELVEVSCRDSGKTPLEASLGDILPTLEKIRWLLTSGQAALEPSNRQVSTVTYHKHAAVEYMPLGVIAAIAPWNYPIHNILNPILAALYSGNAVVVKPSEHTVYSALYVVRMVRRALLLCSLDAELVQVVIGSAEVGEALVQADVDKLFFTGSTGVGKQIAKAAAARLLPVVLELGGKDAFVVCEDAEVRHAAGHCMRGVFQNAGQNCIGVERVFLHKNISQKFVGIVKENVKSLRLGVDLGAMTMGESALEHIEELVQDAVKMGAVLETGGKSATVNGKGWYFEPTILTGVTPKMRIANEEVFGPVLSVFEWEGDEQLAQMVNSCAFGLGSAVFSENRKRANRIIASLRVGMSNVNDFGMNYLCQSMPFGGTKDSGSDRFAGIEGLRGCCIMKSVTRDRFWGVKTRVPKPFKYPVAENAAEFAAEVNDMLYGTGWLSKLDNVRGIIGMLVFKSWRPRSTGSG